jgi:ABC-2 type transport system permease protein
MQAMMLAMIITMLPTIMLSGFIFPISSMPRLLQMLSYIIPARYFLKISRGIMIKGNSFMELLDPMLVLLLVSAILIAFAWKKFDKQVKEL